MWMMPAAALAAALAAAAASAQTAAPPNPSGFGEAISTEAQAGDTAATVTGTVRDPANPPGQLADNIKGFRDALGAAPTPPGNPNPGKP